MAKNALCVEGLREVFGAIHRHKGHKKLSNEARRTPRFSRAWNAENEKERHVCMHRSLKNYVQKHMLLECTI